MKNSKVAKIFNDGAILETRIRTNRLTGAKPLGGKITPEQMEIRKNVLADQ